MDLNLHMQLSATDAGKLLLEIQKDNFNRNKVTAGAVAMTGEMICMVQNGVSRSTMYAVFTSATHVGQEILGQRDRV